MNPSDAPQAVGSVGPTIVNVGAAGSDKTIELGSIVIHPVRPTVIKS